MLSKGQPTATGGKQPKSISEHITALGSSDWWDINVLSCCALLKVLRVTECPQAKRYRILS